MNINEYFKINFNSINIFDNKWNYFFNFCINYFIKFKYSKKIINYIKIIQTHKLFCFLFFIFICWFWSNLLLKFITYFMLVDSIFISLLILQNNSINFNSRRLAKNVILLGILNFNLIGGIFNLLAIIFIYTEWSKFINRLIFKIIKFIIRNSFFYYLFQ